MHCNSGGPWICENNGDCSNTSSTFTMRAGAVQHVNITGYVGASSISSSTCPTASPGTTNSSTTGFPAAECKSCHDVAVGAGVGVPLGIMFLTALAWGLWQTRRISALRRQANSPSQANDPSQANIPNQANTPSQFNTPSPAHVPSPGPNLPVSEYTPYVGVANSDVARNYGITTSHDIATSNSPEIGGPKISEVSGMREIRELE